jgi:hypothetical protein
MRGGRKSNQRQVQSGLYIYASTTKEQPWRCPRTSKSMSRYCDPFPHVSQAPLINATSFLILLLRSAQQCPQRGIGEGSAHGVD